MSLMAVSAESMLEAGHVTLCGFPKAKQIQLTPLLFHRHTNSEREGEPGFSCECGKKKEQGIVTGE